MRKTKLQHITATLVIAALVVTSLVSLVGAAPVAEAVRSTEIVGTIPGGDFAEIWLDLEVMQPGTVTVLATWESGSLDGVGFFVLDEADVATVAGGGRARDNNIAAGNPVQAFRGTSNQQEASFRATAVMYKLVIYNESNADGIFNIQSTNAYIVGDNDNVSDPNAMAADEETDAAVEDEETMDGDEAAADDTAADTAEVAVTAPTTTTATAATAPVTTTAVTTTTAMSTTPGVVTDYTLEGELNEKDAQHYLSLAPEEKDGTVTLTIAFSPSDSEELARRLNFWVLDPEGFNRYLGGSSLSSVALAAGSSTVDTAENERAATFRSVGFTDYTVIVYNTSNVPGAYTLVSEGGLLTDDSAQTLTAQQQAAVVEEVPVADDAAADDAAPAAAATTASSGVVGEPGGTYTIQSGDSMSIIARDVYGDIQLYDEICAYNNMADCDRIEVGDVIELPTEAELGSGAVSTTTAAQPSTTTPVQATTAVSETSTVTATPAVTTTTGVTTTGTVTTTGASTSSAASVVDALAADGRFKTLIAALDAADLVDSLTDDTVTVFAPTDAAFAALPAGALDQLVAQLQTNPTGQLMQILLYHVSSGELSAADFEDGVEIQTLQGNTSKIAIDADGNVTINGAAVTGEELLADNGIIHAIEAVILPPVE